jgi:hypothetical protein
LPMGGDIGAVLYALLGVELALLAISITLLVLSFREHRGRSLLLEALFRATRELTRYEYFVAVVDSIRSAKRSISGVVTGRRPSSDLDRSALNDIVDALRDAVRRGVKVRYIIYKSPERLKIGYLYRSLGAEVRVSPAVAFSDLRYMVVDGSISVLGLAGGERGSPTRVGYLITSKTLAGMLQESFERLWEASEPIEEYTRELVEEIVAKTPHADAEAISSQLDIPRSVVDAILAGRPAVMAEEALG